MATSPRPAGPDRPSHTGLDGIVELGRAFADWSPHLRALFSGSEPETVNALRVRSADPVRPWTTGPVTLLGDAIHNMTPMAGIGANTALRDADLLQRAMVGVMLIVT